MKIRTVGRTWTTAEFETIFHENWEKVYQVLFRMTGSPDDAEDLALETFWRLWLRPPKSQRNITGWLYRVATNLGYNGLRAARRRKQYEIKAGSQSLADNPTRSPASEVERSIQQSYVRRVLSRLPQRQASLLILRHSGLSYQEIAQVIQVSPSSVGKLLNRAEVAFCRLYEQGEEKCI